MNKHDIANENSTKFLLLENAKLLSGGFRSNIYLAGDNLMVVILKGNKFLRFLAVILLLVFIRFGAVGGAVGGLLVFFIEEKISGGIDRRKLEGLREWTIEEVSTLDGVACPKGDVAFNEAKKGVQLDLVSRQITLKREDAQVVYDAINPHREYVRSK